MSGFFCATVSEIPTDFTVLTTNTYNNIMKHLRLTLLSVLTSVSSLYAQEFYPGYTPPKQTGFDSIQDVSPYMLTLEPSGAQGDEWAPTNRYIKQWSNKAPFLEKSISSRRDNESWLDYSVSKDSFLFDSRNNIIADYKYSMYYFNNTEDITRSKYEMTYNQQNQLTSAAFFNANPQGSRNYQKFLTFYYFYDTEGKNIMDSANYENSSYPDTRTYHTYNTAGKLLTTATITLAGDSTNKVENTYDAQNQLLTTTTSYFNATIDEWTTSYTDTFEYSASGQVSRRITYGQVYINGVISFLPFRNEYFTYNNNGQVNTVIGKVLNENDEWVDRRKTVINYTNAGKPLEAFIYPSDGNGGWSTIADFKHVFETLTSLPKTNKVPVIESFYPNPVQQGAPLTVEMRKTASFQLVDIQGKHLFHGTLEKGKNQIPTNLLQKGIYFMHVEGETLATKIIIE